MAAIDQRLDGEQAHDYVAACLAVARPQVATPTWFELAVEALACAWNEAPTLAVPTLAVDVLLIGRGERLSPLNWPAPTVVRDAVRRYEDSVLARLVSDPRWPRLTEGFAGAPAGLRPSLAGLVATQLVERWQVPAGVTVSPAVVRRVGQLPASEVLERGKAAVRRADIAAHLIDGFSQAAATARTTRALLTDAEVLLAENIEALRGLGPRVALGQLALASEAIEAELPVRMRGSIELGDAPTALEEASAFPMGGFSSVSTSGALENLVTSELMYLDGPDGVRPDLFDVRFVEGELLYYARDEAVAVRRKSTVALVLDPSLQAARVKSPGQAHQQLLLALGAIAALVRRMTKWFDRQSLSFELITVGSDEAGLDVEARVLALALKPYQLRGQLTVRTANSSAEAVADLRQRTGARGRAVVYATGWPTALSTAAPEVLVVVAAQPSLVWRQKSAAPPAAGADSGWSALTVQLMHGLLRR